LAAALRKLQLIGWRAKRELGGIGAARCLLWYEAMLDPFRAVLAGLSAVLVACGSGPSLQPGAAGSGGQPGAAGAAFRQLPEGGAAETDPLTEEELRRLLDALEQQIAQP
jgi:hypothetical protein